MLMMAGGAWALSGGARADGGVTRIGYLRSLLRRPTIAPPNDRAAGDAAAGCRARWRHLGDG